MELSEQEAKKVIEDGERIAQMICDAKHTTEQKEEWASTIKKFNALYYQTAVQTWSNTKWRGIPLLKPPTDMWIYQELISKLKPDLIIETGTWAGGSALFMRDILHFEYPSGVVITIDIDWSRVSEGMHHVPGMRLWNMSSVDQETIDRLKHVIKSERRNRVMVILDSDHSKDHVL